jgi:hypothetical protein
MSSFPFPGETAIKERWEAFWACDYVDRPILQITVPIVKSPDFDTILQITDNDWQKKWADTESLLKISDQMIRNTIYMGETIPMFHHLWAIGHALPFGCDVHFARNTIWAEPLKSEADDFPTLCADLDGYWWKWIITTTRRAIEMSDRRYYVYPTWGNHAGDTLGVLRGIQTLMMDLAENREWVKYAVRHVSDELNTQYSLLWDIVSDQNLDGSINYLGSWSPKKTMAFDCDISCMMSTQDFKEIFLPPLIDTMSTVTHRLYHFDGVVALHQLDAVLDVSELHGLQWLPGDGYNNALEFVDVIKKIQSKGKSVIAYAKPDEVMPLLNELSPKGLCLGIECATVAEAERLIQTVKIKYK